MCVRVCMWNICFDKRVGRDEILYVLCFVIPSRKKLRLSMLLSTIRAISSLGSPASGKNSNPCDSTKSLMKYYNFFNSQFFTQMLTGCPAVCAWQGLSPLCVRVCVFCGGNGSWYMTISSD